MDKSVARHKELNFRYCATAPGAIFGLRLDWPKLMRTSMAVTPIRVK
jgi:hypothetical protein